MNDQLLDNFLNKNSNESKRLSSPITPFTEIADSGIASRITPLSSITENKLLSNPVDVADDDDDNQSITIENQFNLIDLGKRIYI